MTRIDVYPADIQPWPAGVQSGRVRAVGTQNGLIVLWTGSQSGQLERAEFPGAFDPVADTFSGFRVTRAAGCACGARALRSAKVPGL